MRAMQIEMTSDIEGGGIARGSVLAIGNFDGVHLGHRSLITAAKRIAQENGAEAAVMTFEPHPREYFGSLASKSAAKDPASPDDSFRLTLLPMKKRIFASFGMTQVQAMDFDAALAALSGQDFIDKILVEKLGVSHVVVGRDFAFGARRSGNVDTLLQTERVGKFGVSLIDPVVCGRSQVYSSTRIRAHIRAGAFSDAADLLGYRWELEAEVIHGDKRGREFGYPTANMDVTRYVRMPYGVYAVRVRIEGDDRVYGGAANFGIRPMFKLETPLLETFIFDFDSDIYGKSLRVEPLQRLRGEMAFSGIDALREQMKQDCLQARSVVKSAP